METVHDAPDCDKCLELQAERADKPLLCPKCARQILPQLKQPGWAKQIGFTHYTEEAEPEQTAPVAKAIRRNQKRFSRLKNPEEGLTCHFCPESCGTPVMARGLVCGPCGEEMRARRTNRGRVHYTGLKSRVA